LIAATKKTGAIAVILSGTGSDGALGVQAVAEEGGIVFAQDPASAKFDGMPRSAIATGCVDFVLPAEEIGSELARIAGEPRLTARGELVQTREFTDSQKEYQALLELVRAGTGIDFSLYRQATVRRRLLRRPALLKLGSVGAYIEYVKENVDELHALTQDILIRVTQFFRDPGAFETLARRVFPALIRKAPAGGAIRVWVPGCSTGEEAYSIVICFLELAAQTRSEVPLQIFATDINEAAIEKARRGIYIDNLAVDVSPERLARFFIRIGKEYQVSRRLRDLCVFSRHDLLNDPPFSRMNLISCRNVLIYLDSMQKEAFSRFHFALNPGGFLLLGKSETAVSSPGLFAPVDREARLYVRQESAGNRTSELASPKRRSLRFPPLPVSRPDVRQPHGIDLRRQADLFLIERYSPPRVIVNSDLEPVTFGGEITALLSSDGGKSQRTSWNWFRTVGWRR
jgi:two-component system, chemotaxis family, CheB/CheR fusion protein